jgi:arginyl-tRNA synthetase
MNSYETIKAELQKLAGEGASFSFDQPEDFLHGDYATNIAFTLSKQKGLSPKACAEELIPILQEKLSGIVEKIEVAGPGFINFYLKDDVRTDEAEEIATHGVLRPLLNEQALVEYTDPNPFKLFHIGHLVPNAIGEALAGIYEAHGHDVARLSYQGDVGMHVAKTIWAMQHSGEVLPEESVPLKDRVTYLGRMYSSGNEAFEGEHKEEIKAVNKKIFERSDEGINHLYDLGKKWSLDYFETLYVKLGTKFDHYIFESEVADLGKEIVKKNLGTVFEESDGAIVYKGEKVGLHTRVFINGEGLPTYEAKELGNAYTKERLVPGNIKSVAVTGNEINDYFKVVKAALSEIDKPLSDRLLHVSHGMLRLPEGKMSSRTGNIIPAEELIDEVSKRLVEKFADMEVAGDEKEKLVNDIAVGAIKFSILKIAPGKDIIFDLEKSISFEGDSGPYLQYTHARISALLDKAKENGISFEHGYVASSLERELEKTLLGYKEVMEKAYTTLGPQHIIQYLLLLTRVFNNMYARVQIVNLDDKDGSAYYVMLSEATRNVLAHGLEVLGIKAPERM